SYDALRLKALGAPAGHVVPSDAALIPYWYLAVPKNAAHPNAAKLFINYALSREAQDVLYDLDYTDHHLVPGSRSAAAIRQAEAPTNSSARRGRQRQAVLRLARAERPRDRPHQLAGRFRAQLHTDPRAGARRLVDEVDDQRVVQRRADRMVVVDVRLRKRDPA